MIIVSDSVNVLGTTYTIEIKSINEDLDLKNKYAYIFYAAKKIVLRNLIEEWKGDPVKATIAKMRECLRHEIIHAFLQESGLAESSLVFDSEGWSKNEEMIDWFAIQSPKIYKAFKEAKCL